MKFSLWRLFVILTLVAIALVWREELWLVVDPVWPYIFIYGTFFLVAPVARLYYWSEWSPVWRLARLMVPYRRICGAKLFIRVLVGRFGIAYGIASEANEELHAGDYESGFAIAEEAVAVAPDYHGGLGIRGCAHYYLERYEDAINDFQNALAVGADEEYRAWLAYSLARLGMFRRVLNELTDFNLDSSEHAGLASLRADANCIYANWKAALSDYKLALQLESTNENAALGSETNLRAAIVAGLVVIG